MKDSFQEFFTTTNAAWEAMLLMCSEAQTSIDMEQYIFTNDKIGARFLELFIKKSKDGVRIRLLCDTAGSYSFYTSRIPEELRHIGIEVRFFNIISPWRIHNFFSWFFRDHRKLLIVDGVVACIGGVGIREDMKRWRDTCVKVQGEIAIEIQSTFNEMWYAAKKKNIFIRIKRSRGYKKGPNIITNAPYPQRRYMYYQLINAIRNSKKYVYLTTPYFVPDPRLLYVLQRAVGRSVDVQIIVPKTSDSVIVNRASHSFFYDLLSSGIRIHQHDGDFIHAKTAVIDDRWATLGSFNFDNLSFTYNHEANIVSTDKKCIETIKEHFKSDAQKSEEVFIEQWLVRPVLWKFREFCIIPFRRFL